MALDWQSGFHCYEWFTRIPLEVRRFYFGCLGFLPLVTDCLAYSVGWAEAPLRGSVNLNNPTNRLFRLPFICYGLLHNLNGNLANVVDLAGRRAEVEGRSTSKNNCGQSLGENRKRCPVLLLPTLEDNCNNFRWQWTHFSPFRTGLTPF